MSWRVPGRGQAAWTALATAAALSLVVGLVLERSGRVSLAHGLWTAVTLLGLLPLIVQVARDAWRRRPGVDLIAVLAMAGALVLGEPFAGAVLALMLATGHWLERFAAGRAERALAALHGRAPRTALRSSEAGLEEIPVERVRVGDALLVREGDVVPVDGLVAGSTALIDESAITGEADPVERAEGAPVASGTHNAGAAFRMRASATAEFSTYAAIIRLVERARAIKAPMARLADRLALGFVPFALALAAGAWAWSGDPKRALAVLVVATPCPLLLAVPVAILGGISRLAARGVIVKGGGALEGLARVRHVFLDKTGTITTGAPRVTRVLTTPDAGDPAVLLALAAGADRASSHVFASALAREAQARGLRVPEATRTLEHRGSGVESEVAGRTVRLGRLDWVAPGEDASPFVRHVLGEGGSAAFVALDGRLAGAILFDDPIRVETPAALRALRRLGVSEIVVLTGDRNAVANAVAGALGVDRVLAEHDPAAKEAAVREASKLAATLMVGDGINDAAALASAGVGVAIGARGATIASEAADVVIVADRFDRVVDAIDIARHTRTVALAAAGTGMVLSLVAMLCAAVGWIAPAAGAIAQEAIDAVALLVALAAATPGPGERRRARALLTPAEIAALRAEHGRLVPLIERLREVGDSIDELEPAPRARAYADVRRVVGELVNHERTDDASLYPSLARRLPGDDPLAGLSRTHQEIFRIADLLDRRLERAVGPEGEAGGPGAGDRTDQAEIRRLLYSLHALLELHFGQEAELFDQVGGLLESPS